MLGRRILHSSKLPQALKHATDIGVTDTCYLQVVWITVIVGLLAMTLSTSNQDSLQNGLVECVGGVFLKNAPVWITRVLVVILTVPCLVVSLQVRKKATCKAYLGRTSVGHILS